MEALSALNDGGKLYDPYYRTDLLSEHGRIAAPVPGFTASDSAAEAAYGARTRRAWYDDFSVSEHLHIPKPQSVALDSARLHQTVQSRGLRPSILKVSDEEWGAPSPGACICEEMQGTAPPPQTTQIAPSEGEREESVTDERP